MLTKKQVYLTGIEAVEGVAETLDPATDAVLILEGATITPEGQVVGSARLNATLSGEPDKIGQKSLSLTATCEFRGNGIVGSAVNPPDFDAMLRASAMKRDGIEFLAVDTVTVTGTFVRDEVITGGTSSATGLLIANVGGGLLYEPLTGTFESGESVTGGDSSASANSIAAPTTGYRYKPTSTESEMKSMTGVRYLDGHKYTVFGARNTFSLNLPTGDKPTIAFTMSGRWSAPAQAPNPTPTLNPADAPLVVNMGLKVGGHAPLGVNALTLDMANTVTKASDLNAADGVRAYTITARKPAGTFDPEAEDLGDYNPIQDWMDGTNAELSFLLGSVPGNRIYTLMPKIQRTAVAYGDREGRVIYNESFEAKRDDVGDDELSMCFF
ncbi:MAG: phage tail tube protein [Pseudodesulfovibrio sp.]|uniref:phage tail tube protein n=1 Tax=Pseudodesulfovibrio sp. TaxID=2035812 RepID=UPI003D1248A1